MAINVAPSKVTINVASCTVRGGVVWGNSTGGDGGQQTRSVEGMVQAQRIQHRLVQSRYKDC